jgi:hypothetical protein
MEQRLSDAAIGAAPQSGPSQVENQPDDLSRQFQRISVYMASLGGASQQDEHYPPLTGRERFMPRQPQQQ